MSSEHDKEGEILSKNNHSVSTPKSLDTAGKITTQTRTILEKTEQVESLQSMSLETENFWIDSADWRMNEYGLLVNEREDVFQDPKTGYQYFTWDAAICETIGIGKRMPTDPEWFQIAQIPKNIQNIKFAGWCGNGQLKSLGEDAYFWSSSVDLLKQSYAYGRHIGEFASARKSVGFSKIYAFSVRILKT